MTLLLAASLLAGRALASDALVVYDLEADDGGFSASGDLGQWSWGPVLHGPGSGWDGANAWSTGREADYLHDSVEYLEIPVPNLAGVSQPALRFQHWYDLADGDSAWVEVGAGNGYAPVEPLYGYPGGNAFTGQSDGWETVVIDLAGLGPAPRVRLAFAADTAVSAAGWTVDAVEIHDGDVAAPLLDGLTELADTEVLDAPYVVTVRAEDDTAVTAVTLYWAPRGGAETGVPMTPLGDGTWTAGIPAQEPDTRVEYRVEATDGGNVAALPASGTRSFRVYLPAPRALTGPYGRVVGTHARLAWGAPDTTHPVLGYQVWRGGAELLEVDGAEALVPLLGVYDVFSVRAVYEAGVGDASDEVVVDAVVPEITRVAPDEAWPGDNLRVTLQGSYLLLVEGAVEAALGSGVAVREVDVRDVDTVVLRVAVDADATPGERTLLLQTDDYTLEEVGLFTVLDADGRPRLTTIEPAEVAQGERGELAITFVGDLVGDPSVDLGEGFVVESVTVEGDVLRVTYACAAGAAIGEHPVVVDDGVRRLEGVTLQVTDTAVAPAQRCATGPEAGALAALLAAMASARRLRR